MLHGLSHFLCWSTLTYQITTLSKCHGLPSPLIKSLHSSVAIACQAKIDGEFLNAMLHYLLCFLGLCGVGLEASHHEMLWTQPNSNSIWVLSDCKDWQWRRGARGVQCQKSSALGWGAERNFGGAKIAKPHSLEQDLNQCFSWKNILYPLDHSPKLFKGTKHKTRPTRVCVTKHEPTQASVGSCVSIFKNDGNQYVDFKIVQKALNKAMMAKELLLSCWQASKSVWILWCIQEKEQ